MKKKNKVNLKRVVKARGGQDMGAGSSGMGSGNTGNTGTGGQVDTGDLGIACGAIHQIDIFLLIEILPGIHVRIV